jgi:predicted permease
VAVINQTLARLLFPDEDAVGKHFHLGRRNVTDYEIVGIAKDAKHSTVRDEIPPTMYAPYVQSLKGLREMSFEVRTIANPTAMVAAIRHAVQEVDSNIPLFNLKTQSEQVNESLAQERLFAKLSSFFGVLALLLASIGLYGLMSYSVARRTHEIGIRMALGAQPGNVRWLVMREMLLMVLIGVAIGLPAAIAATRVVSSMLFGLTATDPWTIALATLFLVGVSALAGYLPARKASRVDPLVALRYE